MILLLILSSIILMKSEEDHDISKIADCILETWTKCGPKLYYEIINGKLFIFGEGEMFNYSLEFKAPWQSETISEVVIGPNVTSIGSYAFFGIRGLYSIVLPNRLNYIGDYSFYRCRDLISIELPDSLLRIGEGSLSETNVKWITIPKNIDCIPDKLFQNCIQLIFVHIQRNIKSVGAYAFMNIENMSILYEGIKNPTYESTSFIGTNIHKVMIKRDYNDSDWCGFDNIEYHEFPSSEETSEFDTEINNEPSNSTSEETSKSDTENNNEPSDPISDETSKSDTENNNEPSNPTSDETSKSDTENNNEPSNTNSYETSKDNLITVITVIIVVIVVAVIIIIIVICVAKKKQSKEKGTSSFEEIY